MDESTMFTAETLSRFLENRFKELIEANILEPYYKNGKGIIIKELRCFGISSLEELENIIPSNLIESIHQNDIQDLNYTFLLRDIMLANNSKKYMDLVWNKASSPDWHFDLNFYDNSTTNELLYYKEIGVDIVEASSLFFLNVKF